MGVRGKGREKKSRKERKEGGAMSQTERVTLNDKEKTARGAAERECTEG